MKTKFDVGQRVTYPVVHTADGNITGIAVSEAGVTRYAIGPKWYAEDDLKPTAEGKPVTEPVKESEPVNLYGIKNDSGWVTKGKIYEFVDGNIRFDEFYGGKRAYESFEKFKECNTGLSACLVPLVRRPAKVGEWVLIVEVRNPSEHIGYVHNGEICLIDEAASGIRSAHAAAKKEQRDSWLWEDEYLVLDGYTGCPA